MKLLDAINGNPWLKGLLQAAEGGALLGLIAATANGFQFGHGAWKGLLIAVSGGAAVAVRNYLIDPNRVKVPAPVAPPPEPPKS